jgi:hypothetical protein
MPFTPYAQAASTAEDAFVDVFREIGWRPVQSGGEHGDLVISDPSGQAHFFAVIKSSPEGRPDRVTALFAQALLESRLVARENRGQPAVLIWVKTASPSLIDRLSDFHARFGDGEAFALMSGDGLRFFSFPGMTGAPTSPVPQSNRRLHRGPTRTRLAFSDRTQWMLKLLLAPEVPDSLLTAPRERYKTAVDLARAAGVSAMTASRFVNALSEKGFLDLSSPYLRLVMRRKLADLWKASYQNLGDALPAKFVVPGPPPLLAGKLVQRHPPSCLSLFAAAEALTVGHVRGVPPSVCVVDLDEAMRWNELKPARDGETPDLLLQPMRFPVSIANGAVQCHGIHVTDVIQVWLDVSAHPARGAEQAALLEQGVLAKALGEDN